MLDAYNQDGTLMAKVLFNTNIKDTERNKTLDKSDEGKNNE